MNTATIVTVSRNVRCFARSIWVTSLHRKRNTPVDVVVVSPSSALNNSIV